MKEFNLKKRNPNLLKLTSAHIGLFCLLLVTLFSCTKDHNSPSTASLMVMNGATGLPAADVYVDNTKVNGQSFNSGDYTAYLNTSAGNRNITLYEPGSKTKIASDAISLNARSSYSLFLSSTYSGGTDNYPGTGINAQPDFILLADAIAQPPNGQAMIRFVDISPNAGAVDLVMNTNTLVSNTTYKGYSSFTPVNSTTGCTFEVRKSGTNVILATLSNVDIKNRAVYTVWLHGLSAGADATALSLGIITNKQY